MDQAISEFRELKEMRENIHRSVNSLEICAGCDRICECEQWARDGGALRWLCFECVSNLPDWPRT